MKIENVLVLGYSDIARRRVLPALARIAGLRVAVASRSRYDQLTQLRVPLAARYADFESALKAGPDLVYVSLVNAEHAEWVERALDRGCHVVVDKPAFDAATVAARLVERARRKGVCIAEATAFAFHPQIEVLRDVFRREGCSPSCLTAQFSFPPLPPENYRYSRVKGGGAILDLASYPVTLGRLFIAAPLREAFCRVTSRETEVETGFTAALVYEGGSLLTGHFGFGTGYINRLDLLGPDLSVAIERVFTTPPDLKNQIDVRLRGVASSLACPAADSFHSFLTQVIESIQVGEHHRFAEALLADARVADALRQSAGL